jgi:cell division protein FtsI (penicillin-binding protein 3)
MIGQGTRSRLWVVASLCVLPLLGVLVRVGWLTVVQGEAMSRRAESQQVRRVWLQPERGRILDRHGEPLAYTMYNQSVVADPAQVVNPRKTAATLAAALGLPRPVVERKLKSSRRQVYIDNRVTPMLDRRIALASLPGISQTLELKRVYPLADAAAHVVGFIDHEEDGQAGIESELDDALRGDPGWATELRDGFGNSYLALGRRTKVARAGNDVMLTLDATLQDVAASELKAAAESLEAKSAALVAVDPRTGDVLAMVSWPAFDPSRVREADRVALRNRVVTDPYEPGSTFKLVAATAALAKGIMRPTTMIQCENGRFNFGGFTVTDHHPHGILTFKDCFAVSSNIAFAKVGRMCSTRLYATARGYGFGSPTGIGLAGEGAGLLRPPSQWSGRTSATLAYGYEVMVTPLQMAMAYAAVANGGMLMRPQLVRRVTTPEGKVVFESRPQPVRRALDPATAATLRSFMREVMVTGTGKSANVDWMDIGGKTGTTEKLKDGAYSSAAHYASFVGIAPLEDPKLVCFILLDEPQGVTFGGSAAAPVFKRVLESFGRLPDSWLSPKYERLLVEETHDARVRSAVWAGARAANAAPARLAPREPEGDGLPDLRGLPLRGALQMLAPYGIQVEVRGSGVVKEQEPAPGSAIEGPIVLTGDRDGSPVLLAGKVSSTQEEKRKVSSTQEEKKGPAKPERSGLR